MRGFNEGDRLVDARRGRIRAVLLPLVFTLSGLFVLAAWMEVRSQADSESLAIAPHLTAEQRANTFLTVINEFEYNV